MGLKQIAESGSGQQVGFWTIGGDASVLHHQDAVDLGDDIGDVVGDEQDASSLLCEFAEQVAEISLSGQVEGVGGFVEEEHAGGGYQSASYHDAALLACGHFAYGLGCEAGCVDLVEYVGGVSAHVVRHGEIGPEGGAGEEAGEDGIQPVGLEERPTGEVG